MGVGLWKWPYCPTILNTVAEMDITIAPNCISCMWLQSDHMCSTPKVGGQRTRVHPHVMEVNLNLCLHLQTSSVLSSEKGSPQQGSENNTTGI